jgi:hypothetical protein
MQKKTNRKNPKKKILITIILFSIWTNECSKLPADKADISFLSFLIRLRANTNLNNSGVIANPITGLETSEAGQQAIFSLTLKTRPSGTVTIPISSSNLSEGNVSPTNLVFNSDNFNLPQTVTVTGVDDFLQDGNIMYKILLGVIVSSDKNYNGLDPVDLDIVNLDNDTPGFTMSPISGDTNELGGSATFTIFLNTQPSALVSLNVSSSDPTEGTASPTSLQFTPTNFRVPQIVTVTGVDDNFADGNKIYSIQFGNSTSADFNYNGITVNPIAVVNLDEGEKRIFNTNPISNGNLGGIAGADALCDLSPNKPPILPNQYKALLVGAGRIASVNPNAGDGQVDWVLKPNIKYFRAAGIIQIQTANANSLFSFNLINSFDLSGTHFTGLNGNWTTSSTCGSWSSASGGVFGVTGQTSVSSIASINNGTTACNSSTITLLCVQQ